MTHRYSQHIREQLDTKVLTALCWVDARDMLADGVTEGVVDRTALHQSMSGTEVVNHEVKLWKSKISKHKYIELNTNNRITYFVDYAA